MYTQVSFVPSEPWWNLRSFFPRLTLWAALFRRPSTQLRAGFRGLGLLLANVEKFFDFCNHFSLFVFHFYLERGLVFRQRLQLLTNIVELRVAQAKFGADRALPRLTIADAGRLVPNDVFPAQIRHHHQHIESVGHGKERSAEMRADVVGVPPAQLHFDVDGLHVGRDMRDADARAQERRPEVDPAAQCVRRLRPTEELKKDVVGSSREPLQRLKAHFR